MFIDVQKGDMEGEGGGGGGGVAGKIYWTITVKPFNEMGEER